MHGKRSLVRHRVRRGAGHIDHHYLHHDQDVRAEGGSRPGVCHSSHRRDRLLSDVFHLWQRVDSGHSRRHNLADSSQGALRHRVAQGVRDRNHCVDSGDDRGALAADGAGAVIVSTSYMGSTPLGPLIMTLLVQTLN
jgi:hypothetical protein